MYRLGIDPGLQGALALIDNDFQIVNLGDMPLMAMGKKGKKQVNAAELAKIISLWLQNRDIVMAIIEYVSAQPGQGVSAMFNFGKSCGVIEGVVGTLRIPMVLVTPQTWKKRAGLSGKPKDTARTLAQQLYPGADLAQKKDIGRADALLIARYGLK